MAKSPFRWIVVGFLFMAAAAALKDIGVPLSSEFVRSCFWGGVFICLLELLFGYIFKIHDDGKKG
jgi:predicted cation transporter